jgi:predicted DNA binding protein
MISLTLDMVQYDCPFIDTTDDHETAFSATQWEFDARDEQLETRMAVEAPDRMALDAGLRALRDHPNMNDYRLLAKRGGVAGIRTTIEETSAMAAVRDAGGYIVGPFHIEGGSERWHVGFDTGGTADDALSAIDRENDFEVLTRESVDLTDLHGLIRNAGTAISLMEGCRDLSATERETLEAAVSGGYFETPRRASLGTLAEEFGVSKPAVSKTLRRAQRKTLGRVVDALAELDDAP